MSAQHCDKRAPWQGQVRHGAWRVLYVEAICCTRCKAVGTPQVCYLFIKQALRASCSGHCCAAARQALHRMQGCCNLA